MDRTWETGFESVSFLRYESQILDLLIDFLGLEYKVKCLRYNGPYSVDMKLR